MIKKCGKMRADTMDFKIFGSKLKIRYIITQYSDIFTSILIHTQTQNTCHRVDNLSFRIWNCVFSYGFNQKSFIQKMMKLIITGNQIFFSPDKH